MALVCDAVENVYTYQCSAINAPDEHCKLTAPTFTTFHIYYTFIFHFFSFMQNVTPCLGNQKQDFSKLLSIGQWFTLKEIYLRTVGRKISSIVCVSDFAKFFLCNFKTIELILF